VSYRVFFSPEARADLLELYDYIAERSGEDRAFRYVERIEHWVHGLERFPERGTRRDDIRPGLRVAGFERRASIAFEVQGDTVTILRILYAGRDLETTALHSILALGLGHTF
jgi:toxin ParE1/3/4